MPLKALNVFLLAGSVVYFALLSPVLGSVLVAATVFTYGVSTAIARTRARGLWLGIGIIGLLVLLVLVRYENAVGPNVGVLSLPLNGRPADPWGLTAVVVSFFGLLAVARLVETYRKPQVTDLDPIRTALSLLLFPFLLAGPIVRRKEMAEQLIRRVVSVANFAYGMRRFAIGLFKKVAIAEASV